LMKPRIDKSRSQKYFPANGFLPAVVTHEPK